METLAQAGVAGGSFAYWKERIDDAGADIALEVVCQAIAFGEAIEAASFVAALRAEADSLSVTVAGVAIAGDAPIREIAAPPELEDARAFRIEDSDGLVRYAVVVASERVVLSVHLGGPRERVTLAGAVTILDTMIR